MKNKKVIWTTILSLACACTLSFGAASVLANADGTEETPATITDTCDVTSGGVFSEIFKMTVGTTDYGWGTDGKYRMSNFTPTTPITLSTWSSGGYPYVRYNLSGQNTIKVLAYENPKTRDKFDEVFCFVKQTDNTNVQLKAVSEEVSETSSKGWCQVTYTYCIESPELAKWVQFTQSTFTDETIGVARDDQHIGNIEISYQATPAEPVIPDSIEDNCDSTSNSVIADIYRMSVGTTDYGWGTDGKYRMSNITPTAPITLSTWSSGGYPYVRYTLSGQNLVKVVTYENPKTRDKFDEVFCFVKQTDNTNVQLTAINEVVSATSEKGWCQVEYTYHIDNASSVKWIQFTQSTFTDETIGVARDDQHISNVLISYAAPEILQAQKDLRDYATAKGAENYSTAGWSSIQSITSTVLTALESAEDLTAVATQAKADIDAVKTLAEEMAIALANAKMTAKGELDAYVNADDYREAQKAELATAIANGKTAIDGATDIAGVETALANAKAVIDEIKTDAELTAEELANAKTTAKGELDIYVNADDYREAQKTELATAIANGKTAIDGATDIAGVETALANAKAVIDEIKTDAELTAEELANAKTTAKGELDAYVNAEDYRDAQKTELATAIANGKTAIDGATDIACVETALANAKAVIDEIKTDVELTAEETAIALANAKTTAKAELDTYVNAEDYRDAQKAELATAIANGKTAIDGATDIACVETALANAKAVIDEIKTDAELTAEEQANKPSVNNPLQLTSCQSSVFESGVMGALVLVLMLAVVLKLKKKEEN